MTGRGPFSEQLLIHVPRPHPLALVRVPRSHSETPELAHGGGRRCGVRRLIAWKLAGVVALHESAVCQHLLYRCLRPPGAPRLARPPQLARAHTHGA